MICNFNDIYNIGLKYLAPLQVSYKTWWDGVFPTNFGGRELKVAEIGGVVA